MLLAYSSDPELQRGLSLSAQRAVEITSNWQQLQRRMGNAACVIAHLHPLNSDTSDRFAALKFEFSHIPVVAVVDRVPEVAMLFRHTVIEELVWTEQIQDRLNVAIERAIHKGFFQQIVKALDRETDLTRTTKMFLTLAVQKQRPYRTVQAIAAALDVDTKTVHNHWNASGISASRLSPKDFLDWTLLLRAAALRSSGTTWPEIAKSLAAHPRTFHRIARRLLDSPLPNTQSSAFVSSAFCRTVVPVLLRSSFHEFDNISAFCHYGE